jgi:hypothetical protein
MIVELILLWLVTSVVLGTLLWVAQGGRITLHPVCAFKGHLWHEGEDTLQTIAGSPNSGFHYGAYTWRCHRCSAKTGEDDPPPPNHSWDHSWVSPADDPHAWGDREGRCSEAYRHIRDNVGELVPPGRRDEQAAKHRRGLTP